MEPTITFTTRDDECTTKIDALAGRLGVEPEPEGGRSDGQMRYLLSVNKGDVILDVPDREG